MQHNVNSLKSTRMMSVTHSNIEANSDLQVVLTTGNFEGNQQNVPESCFVGIG